MLKKCAILGLVVLAAGGAALGWIHREAQEERREAQSLASASTLGSREYIEKYGRLYQLSPEQQNQLVLELDQERKSKSADQLAREQQARLTADLDELAAGQMNPGDIADFLYGPGWESQVEQHKLRREQRETAQTVAISCLSMGGALFGGCVVVGLLRLVARVIERVRKRSAEPGPETAPETVELTDIELHDSEPEAAPEASPPPDQPKQRRRLLTLSESDGGGLRTPDWGFECTPSPRPPSVEALGEDSSVAVLMADEPSAGGWSPQAQWSWNGGTATASENLPQEQLLTGHATVRQRSDKDDATVKDSLKGPADELQKQIAEFKRMTENVQQATRDQSAPLSDTLKELTQQVSAIREYAASQQGRVEKLQDGYDWGIIRTFCLRVIRCIDNLEGRLADLPKEDSAGRHLEEVKDELLFALESSGVEQYRPELNSEFHGQEKVAEALKEKQPAKKPEQAGRIARIIRPGYRYMMDDENYRIVRTAQVKIYG
jgi:molecular chaperone GrpE (heat shock protein)